MTPEQFAYWFKGFVELNGTHPTAAQWKSICEHLETVFKKVTPPVSVPSATPTTPQDWAEYFKIHPVGGQTVGVNPHGITIC